MNIADPFRYGAAELRAGYNRNLSYALGLSIAFHLVCVGAYLLWGRTGEGSAMDLRRLRPPIPIVQEPYIFIDPAVSPETGSGSHGGSAGAAERAGSPEVAGTPVAANPLDSADGLFAGIANLPGALPAFGDDPAGVIGGSGNLGGASFRNNSQSVIPPDAELSPDEFVAVEENPTFDAAELARNVRYPELARRNGIGGTVVVRVLIDRNGRALKTMIDHSDHVALDAAARDAVMNTTYTPAIQNRMPVPVWMQVPVVFRLQ